MLSKSLSVGERRNSTRLKLASAVRIHRRGELQAIETVTEDLSSEGFYCISERPFSPHEWLECELTISSAQPGVPLNKGLVLKCTAEVSFRRVEFLRSPTLRDFDSILGPRLVNCIFANNVGERELFVRGCNRETES